MNLYIDNNDGLGGVDYTSALMPDRPLTITRKRDAWTQCSGGLDVIGAGLALPTSRARVLVTDAASAVLFQGFLAWDTEATSSAAAVPVAEERPELVAFESAWLTQSEPADILAPSTAAVHSVALGDIALSFGTVKEAAGADLATDVTVSGENEASTYVTELFRGDGTTSTFDLAHPPFRATGSETLLTESFDDTTLNASVWTKTDTGSYLTLGSGGLAIGGGTGFDGATVLQFANPVEMGGTLMAQATALTLTTGSDGVLMGFYNGLVQHALCIAGVRVQGAGSAHTLVAVVNGTDQTTSYSFTNGHTYAIRVRLHSPEVVRIPATYTVLVDGALRSFAGSTISAPLHVVIEIVDTGLASSTLPTVLYDGSMATSPTQCIFAPVNSTSIVGSIAAVELMQQGSAWVVSTATDGTVTTRREGTSGTGADLTLSTTGNLSFAAGRVPQPGELVTVSYRRSKRAVARLKDANADELRASLALPGLPSWAGHVTKPPARTSADCTSAAQALLVLAGGSATGKSGHAEWVREAAIGVDVHVGDTLSVTTTETHILLPVQAVTVTDASCVPEILHYRADFVQSRAQSMAFTISSTLAVDVPQPIAVTASIAGLPVSLAGLQVISASTSALAMDAGVDPPSGGGFEVRRSEASFGSPSTADLVLSSPVRGFSIPRLAFAERFFVRMYDGSTPRNYSRLSSAVLTSLPIS
jgi:hypothetical protein